jgi:nanoRNase/pAp phosphatase (c-di-AMP/oligoRNAs hydrolase)
MRAAARFLSENRGKRTLVVAHSQADADAAASALAVASFFREARACVPDILGSPGKRVAAAFGGEFCRFPCAGFEPEAVVVVDTNSLALLPGMKGFFGGFCGPVAVIDHHSRRQDTLEAGTQCIDERASSTCEIVYGIFKELNYPITRSVAETLLAGILADSSDFRSADTRTLETVAYLLKRTPLSLAQLFEVAEGVPDASQRIAVLKALSRSSAVRAGDFIIATSEAASFEGVAAERLVSLGADYAFVAQVTHHQTRISARCRPALVQSVGADVGEIMREAGAFIGGSGGGHPAAAGADGPLFEKAGEALELCVRLARGQLKKSGAEAAQKRV